MRTISHQRSSSRRRLIIVVVLGFVAVLALRTPLAYLGVTLAPLDAFGSSIESLAPRALSWLRDRTAGFDTLRYERDQARAERDSARAELEWLHAAMPDFERIHTLIASPHEDRIVAGVLSVPNESPYDSLIIDRGERDGVVHGSFVYAEHNRPIGTVVEVTHTTATIMLFTSPGAETLMYAPREGVFAPAMGMGGGVFSVRLPHGSPVAVGDPLVMPTISGGIVGVVERVWSDPAEPGVLAAATASTSLRSLHIVAVDRMPLPLPTPAHIREVLRAHATSTAANFTLPADLASSTASSTSP